MNIVITGGPGSGKTTLINYLKRKGYTTHSELAIELIDEMIDEWGLEKFKAWKQENLLTFQSMILERQLNQESNLSSTSLRFFDRGHLDPLAYLNAFQKNALMNRYFHDYQNQTRSGALTTYHLVFHCDSLSDFNPRYASGRTESADESNLLGCKLKQIYQDFGFQVISLKNHSIEERIDHIFQTIQGDSVKQLVCR